MIAEAEKIAGNKCQYFNCNSRRIKGLRMFRFPYKDPILCRKWVIECGKKNNNNINIFCIVRFCHREYSIVILSIFFS